MPQFYEIGRRAYFQVLDLNRDSPVIHTAPTYETEDPYRVGKSLIIRLWPSARAVVLGRWVRKIDMPRLAELTALRAVMEPRRTDTPYWCPHCGRGEQQCRESRHSDKEGVDPCRGYCPACDRLWADCWCLEEVDLKYAGGIDRTAEIVAAKVTAAIDDEMKRLEIA